MLTSYYRQLSLTLEAVRVIGGDGTWRDAEIFIFKQYSIRCI